MNPTLIEVPKEWFVRLLDLAKTVNQEKPDKYKKYNPFLHQHLAQLLGYIDSAKIIIK